MQEREEGGSKMCASSVPLELHWFLFALLLHPYASVFGAAAEREARFGRSEKEGRLVLYTGMDKTDEANLYTKEFSKRYPFITSEIFRSSGEKCRRDFSSSTDANTHTADIFQTSIIQVYQLKNLKLLARYVSR